MKMQAARMYGYKEPLRIDEVPVPKPGPDEILLKVAACGMCRSDYQLVDGYFKGPFPVEFPYIPATRSQAEWWDWAARCLRRWATQRATWSW